MATFRDGIEAAAKCIDAMAERKRTYVEREEWRGVADKLRSIEEPAEPLDAIEDGFQQFKSIWPKGPRNHWTPAKRAFKAAVKTRKHAISAILTGTQAYVATQPEFQYIPAPTVFLNQDRFLTDYQPNGGGAPRGNKTGASSLFDVEHRLSGAR